MNTLRWLAESWTWNGVRTLKDGATLSSTQASFWVTSWAPPNDTVETRRKLPVPPERQVAWSSLSSSPDAGSPWYAGRKFSCGIIRFWPNGVRLTAHQSRALSRSVETCQLSVAVPADQSTSWAGVKTTAP